LTKTLGTEHKPGFDAAVGQPDDAGREDATRKDLPVMADMELLDSARHAALRVSAAPDRNRHFVQLVADEFLPAALHYPILFARHPETGDLYPGALMGLVPEENLCLGANGTLTGCTAPPI
jgi:hypothetical protein